MHFFIYFKCPFVSDICFCVFPWGFVLLWALLAICYVWDYISNAVTSLCWLWFQLTMLLQHLWGALWLTLQVTWCDILSEVWCPEECSNNVLIKAGKLTHLSTSLPVSVLLGTLSHLLPAVSSLDLLCWLRISVTFICAHILKSRKTQNKETLL